jgi:hypothetical protein
VLLNWLASGRGPLLLSSRVVAGLWTPEPVDLPVADALKMAKGNAPLVSAPLVSVPRACSR